MNYEFSDKVRTLQPSAIREIFKLGKDTVSLAGGTPAPETFPTKELAEISNEILTQHPYDVLKYSVSEGYLPLREQIKEYARTHFSIDNPGDAVLITAGAQQANDIAVKIFCNDGDGIACDRECFIGSINSFKSNDQHITGVDADECGMIPEALEKAVESDPTIKMVYLVPSFQNPTGVTMPLERRKAIYEVAKTHGLMIIEDNPYGQLRFKGEDVPTFKSFDTEGIVCYSGTFSKVVAPGLRVGYMIADQQIVDRGTLLKQFSDIHTNIWAQMVVYEYYRRYDTDAHIAAASKYYSEKCALMCKLVRELFPENISCNEPEGGMFVWCRDTTGKLDSARLIKRLLDEENVAIISGDIFMANGGPSHAFRLNFTVPTKDEIEFGVRAVARVIKTM